MIGDRDYRRDQEIPATKIVRRENQTYRCHKLGQKEYYSISLVTTRPKKLKRRLPALQEIL